MAMAYSRPWPFTTGGLYVWDKHLERLRRSCLRLELPEPDMELLEDEARLICQGREKSVLKIIVFRGGEAAGYGSDAAQERLPVYCNAGPGVTINRKTLTTACALRVCHIRLAHQPALPGIKHLNRLEQVMARREWHEPGIAEGLMCDEHDAVVEGTMSNLFLIRGGALLTPMGRSMRCTRRRARPDYRAGPANGLIHQRKSTRSG